MLKQVRRWLPQRELVVVADSSFAVLTLLAHRFSARRGAPPRVAAWYIKEAPTFADVLALVRSHLWQYAHFSLSQKNYDLVQIPRPLFDCLTETLCYTA